MIMMSVHYVYMHVNFTHCSHSCPHVVDFCFWPFCFGKLCVIACISWSLGIWQPNCWYRSPCSYQSPAPVVVNAPVPQSSPSAISTQDACCTFQSFITLMLHSDGDFKYLRVAQMCTQPPSLPQHTPHDSPLFFIVSWHKICVKHKS